MKPALFLHIQKTAGTSVQEMARFAYGDNNVISHGDYVELGIDGCAAKDFVSGHFGFSFAEKLMQGRYCFTFLRDPQERIISLYNYCRRAEGMDEFIYEAARRHNLEGFLDELSDHEMRDRIWNNQVWQLSYGYHNEMALSRRVNIGDVSTQDLLSTAKRNLDRFDYVGLVDQFDQDIQNIFKNLGRKRSKVRHANRTSPAAEISPRAKRLLSSLTVLDDELYDYAIHNKIKYHKYTPIRWLPEKVSRIFLK